MRLKARRKTRKPDWNLWKDGVTQSFLKSFLACREQTRLSYVEGWTPTFGTTALSFGSCSHWCLLQIYKDRVKPREAIERYMQLHAPSMETEKARKERLQMLDVIELVLHEYTRYWRGDWTGKYGSNVDWTVKPKTWLGLEKPFLVSYRYPDGKETHLRGVFDGTFDSRAGTHWLFETKNLSRIDEDEIADGLAFDFQLNFYLLALWLRDREPPKGAVFNVIRRPGQRDKNHEKLLKKIHDDIRKRPEHYFKRWSYTPTPDELMEFRNRILDPMMVEVRAWQDGLLPTYLNPNALTNKYGRVGLYNLIVYGDTRLYRRREVPFHEVEEAK